MKRIIDSITAPVRAVWEYIKGMNSEPNGGISIKRNMAWGIATLAFIVELYSLYRLPCATKDEITFFVHISIVYVITDLLFVCLALSITTFEKITDLVQRIKGGLLPRSQGNDKPAEPDPLTDNKTNPPV